ncbi:MAG: fibronectin type III domain-containing protein, partial [Crocinitomicaceae bacterium]|nr:fibronectin type III domain-containing protein [Crocinitomicaceae bacterium]
MKKFLLFLTSVLFSFQFNSQILNQSAAWPNVTWTLSGTYDAGSLLADPTLSANFSYDDDNAGGGSTDILEASSPAIDLTAAYVGGETWINVSYDYDYNFGDVFILEWYDADALVWVAWDAIPENSSAMSAWCAALTGAVTTSTTLDISAFTGTQLSGFQYRFNYDASSAWGWGFCMAAPTITSASPPSCMDPTALGATNITATSADLSWMAGGTETLWNIEYGPAGFTPGSGTTVSGVTNPHTLSGLTGATGYDYYVQADCGGSGTSAFAGPY